MPHAKKTTLDKSPKRIIAYVELLTNMLNFKEADHHKVISTQRKKVAKHAAQEFKFVETTFLLSSFESKNKKFYLKAPWHDHVKNFVTAQHFLMMTIHGFLHGPI